MVPHGFPRIAPHHRSTLVYITDSRFARNNGAFQALAAIADRCFFHAVRKWAASDSVLGSSAVMSDPYWAASTTCRACGGQSVAGSYLCARCWPIMGRIETRKDPKGRGRAVDKQARLRAMQRQFDPLIDGYRCYFTHVELKLAAGTRRSAEWAHRTAGDESSVVLACKLVNRMQTDLTEPEFEVFVKALARHFEGEPFDESAFPPDR